MNNYTEQSGNQKETPECKDPIIVGRAMQQPLKDDFEWEAINKSNSVSSTIENGYLNAFISKYGKNHKPILNNPFVAVDLFPRSPLGNFFAVIKDTLKAWPYLIGTLLLLLLMVGESDELPHVTPANFTMALSGPFFIILVGWFGVKAMIGRYHWSGLSLLGVILGNCIGCAILYLTSPQIIRCDIDVSLAFIMWYFMAHSMLCVIEAICRVIWTNKYFAPPEGAE